MATQDSSTTSTNSSSPPLCGDPEAPLLWTSKSTRHLADALVALGHQISHDSVGRLLEEIGYSLQANRKTEEGNDHPDRDAQFEYINRCVRRFQRRQQPVVSVDAKKRELIGNFRNPGREWQPEGSPQRVRTHDFRDKELGVGIPYGVYDLTRNDGWVSVGIDHNTAEFATESVRRWWERMGSLAYPAAEELLMTADGGGSNGNSRSVVEVDVATVGRPIGSADHGLSLPARGRASGTRSSTGCSATSRRTGGAVRWSAGR